MKMSIKQINMCKHALGIDREKYSYRNYYNSGYQQDSHLDELVDLGLMSRRETSKEMGGFYYHMTEKGIDAMKQILGPFKVKHD